MPEMIQLSYEYNGFDNSGKYIFIEKLKINCISKFFML